MKKHIITIAGKPGSGKSTTADLLAKKLGYGRYSVGNFMRDIANRRGVTLSELGEYAKNNPEIDREIDEENKRVGTHNELVVDARLAFFFIPDSFKVYLDLDLAHSAERIFVNQTEARVASGESTTSAKELETLLKERLENEKERYMKHYGINHLDLSNYDLVIDTEDLSLDEVVHRIIDAYNTWLKQ